MARFVHSGPEMGEKLLQLLGVPSQYCYRATIRMEAGSPLTIEAEYYASTEPDPNTGDLETVLRKFQLVERDV